jgi:hypothetical protein
MHQLLQTHVLTRQNLETASLQSPSFVSSTKNEMNNSKQKTDYRKPHSLDYRNGYAIQRQPILGIGLEPLEDGFPLDPVELLNEIQADPHITYGNKQFHHTPTTPRFVPAHVAFDKVVRKITK